MTTSSKFASASYANRSKEFREAVQRVRKRQHELQEILKAEHEESGEEASDEQVWSLTSRGVDRGQGGLGPPNLRSNKNKCVFRKRTIKVCFSCS